MLVVPTGAVIEDSVQNSGIVVSPHGGPNGAYAEIGAEENLTIDLATIGVNSNALTSIRNVFDITNEAEKPLVVWITHDATELVRFLVDGDGSIDGEHNGLVLGPGQTRPVHLQVNTLGQGVTEEPLLREFDLNVASVQPVTPTPTPTETPDQEPSGAVPTPVPPTATPTPAPPAPSTPTTGTEDVTVEFDDPTDGPVTVREITMEELRRLDDVDRGPRAVINHSHGTDIVVGRECPCRPDATLEAVGAEALITVNEEISFSGARSTIGSVQGVNRELRLVKAVNIDVPPDRRSTGSSIRIRINEERFEGSDPSTAKIARLTNDGWQMLPTRIAGREDGQVILEARTPGFSVFAVYASTDVRYDWTVDGETVTAESINLKWDEPGFHTVTLTVTDAFGRSDTSTYEVLVNDQPSVTIEVEDPANLTGGVPATLRANVTNEVGNASVTWSFPDGSQQVGSTAQYAFERGDQTVRVVVEDEYGAVEEAEATVSVRAGVRSEPTIVRLARDMPFGARVGAIALLSILLVPLSRRISGGLGDWAIPDATSLRRVLLTRRPPQIVTVDAPTVDVSNRRFTIGHLMIEDPDGDLAAVEISIHDRRGTEVAHKTIDMLSRSEYAYVARNEIVPPKSRVYVRDDEEYTVTVRARDSRDQWTSQRQQLTGASPVAGI